ncbi:ABC transporter ATP-binding protein [Caldisericum exile]|uniref:ABC transporter ATP-binding protein n=1 Tax=Caldisericum exile (strain DSM 21853 / NBRC 104410 / AZM16c01) TaxID=511051 RepID=A0A7U6GFK0_CALEA|nr:ABC transporter ATP-binding protein [Caldisericum exile]BAL81497.1 putative ABC transporter ATP-binding protein [Caldisericum exile AZM16c01]
MKENYLELRSIRKTYGNVIAVNDFSLSVNEGELVSLLGPSGCGKTTLLRSIAGFERVDSGEILVDSKVINDIPPEKRDVAIVFQSYALFPHMTVFENVAFSLMIKGVSKTEQEKVVMPLLQMLRIENLKDRFPRQLSGGQQQRVALARALAKKPKILLLDEPLSALDAKVREEVRVEIRRVQKELGITSIYVTHDQAEALSISDRIVVMNAGVIQQVGTPVEIYRSPKNLFVANFVGVANIFHGYASNGVFDWHGISFKIEDRRVGDFALAVRPELMKISKEPQGINSFKAIVDVSTFLGSFARITLRAFNEMVQVDVPIEEASRYEKGMEVFVSFAESAALLIER